MPEVEDSPPDVHNPLGTVLAVVQHDARGVYSQPVATYIILARKVQIETEGAVNFAFIGQFAETERDTIFTTEYSIRTGMEAVYTLLDIDRGVPEVWASCYDVRDLVHASVAMRDGEKLTEAELPLKERLALKEALRRIEGTDIEKLLRKYKAI